MTNKTLRNSLTALSAFAIAATFVSASSFATEFTVHQGKRYRAILALKAIEQLADNSLIAQKFRDLGFSRVRVSGAARWTRARPAPGVGQDAIAGRGRLRRIPDHGGQLRIPDWLKVSAMGH